MGGGLKEWVKKGVELKTTNWLLENNHGDVKCSIGNIVNNILRTLCGVRWV